MPAPQDPPATQATPVPHEAAGATVSVALTGLYSLPGTCQPRAYAAGLLTSALSGRGPAKAGNVGNSKLKSCGTQADGGRNPSEAELRETLGGMAWPCATARTAAKRRIGLLFCLRAGRLESRLVFVS